MTKAGTRAPADSQAPQNLLAEPRRRKILEWLQEMGSARVRDLSAAFGVTEATIRGDLEKLEADGYITREHGGAYLNLITLLFGQGAFETKMLLFYLKDDTQLSY